MCVVFLENMERYRQLCAGNRFGIVQWVTLAKFPPGYIVQRVCEIMVCLHRGTASSPSPRLPHTPKFSRARFSLLSTREQSAQLPGRRVVNGVLEARGKRINNPSRIGMLPDPRRTIRIMVVVSRA